MADIQQKTIDPSETTLTHPDNPEPVEQTHQKTELDQASKSNQNKKQNQQRNQQNVENETKNQNYKNQKEDNQQIGQEAKQKENEVVNPKQNEVNQQAQQPKEEKKNQVNQQVKQQIKIEELAKQPSESVEQANVVNNNQVNMNQQTTTNQQKVEDVVDQQQKAQPPQKQEQEKVQQNPSAQQQAVQAINNDNQAKQQLEKNQINQQHQNEGQNISPSNQTPQKTQSFEQPEPPLMYQQSEIKINLTGKLEQGLTLQPSNQQIQIEQTQNKQQIKQFKQEDNKPQEKQKAQEKQQQRQEQKQFQKSQEKQQEKIQQKQQEKPSQKSQVPEQKKQQKIQSNAQQQKKQGTTGIDINYFQTKIEQSLIWKQKGTQMFKAKIYDKAIQFYTEGMKQIDPSSFYGATKQQCQRMAQIAGILLYNIGCCYYNLKKYEQSQIFYNEALTINHKYTKAYYKRALSRFQQKKLEGALTDIKSAYSLDKSSQIHDSYVRIATAYNQQINRNKEAQKVLTSKMFGSEKKQKKQEQESKLSKSQFEQQQKSEGSISSWVVPVILGVAALGIYAYQKFKK